MTAFDRLKRLSLADNQLVNLPPQMAGLSQLKWLVLSGNRLDAHMAYVLVEMPELSSLSVANNAMSPSEELALMKQLRNHLNTIGIGSRLHLNLLCDVVSTDVCRDAPGPKVS
jgi:Leucine-rich repeat (LRR) protein